MLNVSTEKIRKLEEELGENGEKLILDFIYNFYGYGNLRGKYWFVGMEENGGYDLNDVVNRISTWESRGKQKLEELVQFCESLGPDYYNLVGINGRIEVQPTWKKLMWVLFTITGEKRTVKEFQKESWGQKNSDNCLLELLPLPSPSIKKWPYGNNDSQPPYSELPYLRTRKEYKDRFGTERISRINKLITDYKPIKALILRIHYIFTTTIFASSARQSPLPQVFQ